MNNPCTLERICADKIKNSINDKLLKQDVINDIYKLPLTNVTRAAIGYSFCFFNDNVITIPNPKHLKQEKKFYNDKILKTTYENLPDLTIREIQSKQDFENLKRDFKRFNLCYKY
jgi:hypothetical protein